MGAWKNYKKRETPKVDITQGWDEATRAILGMATPPPSLDMVQQAQEAAEWLQAITGGTKKDEEK